MSVKNLSIAGGLAAILGVAALGGQPANAQLPLPDPRPLPSDCPANTPSALAPPADQDLAFALDAQGVQRYQCVQSTTGFAWTFVAPDADLFPLRNANGLLIHHFNGPTWLFKDSSSVVAARDSGVTVDPTAIEWLLLRVTRHGGAPGKLSDIEFIQRLSTVGGRAPSTGCDADHVGAEADVLYTARYAFYHDSKNPNPIRCGAR